MDWNSAWKFTRLLNNGISRGHGEQFASFFKHEKKDLRSCQQIDTRLSQSVSLSIDRTSVSGRARSTSEPQARALNWI